jgi:hypothetical protein
VFVCLRRRNALELVEQLDGVLVEVGRGHDDRRLLLAPGDNVLIIIFGQKWAKMWFYVYSPNYISSNNVSPTFPLTNFPLTNFPLTNFPLT